MSVSSASEAKYRLQLILAKDRVSIRHRKPTCDDYIRLFLDAMQPVHLLDSLGQYKITNLKDSGPVKFRLYGESK